MDNKLSDRHCELIVVKTTERCNLNCSYCYMFNGGDQSYKHRPPVMSIGVVEALMHRVREHCDSHKIATFTFVLHGGEPLVAPPKYYRSFFEVADRVLGDDIAIRYAVQTNGTLLTSEWCNLFREYDVGVSFSIDGPKYINDFHRKDKKGNGSFDKVLAGWRLAVAEGIKPGLLMVIDVNSDPDEIYNFVKELNPRTVDFLLPDATYDKPPPPLSRHIQAEAPYADWLLRVFDRWTADGSAEIKIRIFLQVMRSLLGITGEGYDVLGTGDIRVLVVESDGEIQPLDGLRFCGDGIVNTPFNVSRHRLDDAYELPLIQRYYDSHENLCATCLDCAVKTICGGGFLAHRHSTINSFDNPSVYCNDLRQLIDGVHTWFDNNLPEEDRHRVIYHPIT